MTNPLGLLTGLFGFGAQTPLPVPAAGIFWRARLMHSFNLALSESIGVAASQGSYPGTSSASVGLSLQSSIGMSGAVRAVTSMDLHLAQAIEATGYINRADLTLAAALAITGTELYTRDFGLDLANGLAVAGVGHSVVTYDTSVKSAAQNGVASPAHFTWSHTAAAGSYAIVAISSSQGIGMFLPGTTATVDFGGVTLTSLGAMANNNATNTGEWTWVFGGDVSSAGSGAKTVSVTVTKSGGSFFGYGTSYTYTNVISVGALQTAFGASGNPSLSVPSATGLNRVWGLVHAGSGGNTLTSFSLTQLQSNTSDPLFKAGDAAGATSVTVSATSSFGAWSAVGLDLV